MPISRCEDVVRSLLLMWEEQSFRGLVAEWRVPVDHYEPNRTDVDEVKCLLMVFEFDVVVGDRPLDEFVDHEFRGALDVVFLLRGGASVVSSDSVDFQNLAGLADFDEHVLEGFGDVEHEVEPASPPVLRSVDDLTRMVAVLCERLP